MIIIIHTITIYFITLRKILIQDYQNLPITSQLLTLISLVAVILMIRNLRISNYYIENRNEDKVDSNFSEENTSFNEKNEELSRIMGNLNLKEPNITNINSQNQSYSSNSKNSINQNYNLSDNYKIPNPNINTNTSTYDYFRSQPYKVQTDDENINSNFQG